MNHLTDKFTDGLVNLFIAFKLKGKILIISQFNRIILLSIIPYFYMFYILLMISVGEISNKSNAEKIKALCYISGRFQA